jgi:alkanesulfonate monooxygenase SsuD/methylene tetrahydromethanopterin reductase-like flavin-dependent oxidoreductase (luciferase family)
VKINVGVTAHNYEDWPRVRAGDFSHGPKTSDAAILDKTLALGDLVEPLGFDGIWVPDHFGTPYCMGNPMQVLSYFAGRTERIEFGTMVIVLPWYNPIQIAHQIAYLDILSKGRYTMIGLGRGVARSEYDSLAVSRDESRVRFQECLDIIELALTTERFSYDGEIFKVPESSLRPQPLTKDLPTRFYGASATNTSLEYMARRGLKPLGVGNKPITALADDVRMVNTFRREEGMAPTQPRTVLFMCCTTDKDQLERAKHYAAVANQAVSFHYDFDDPNSFKGIKGYEAYAASEPTGMGKDDRAYNTASMLIGTPDEILQRIIEGQELTSYDEIALHASLGGMPFEECAASLTLFAQEVLPELHKYDAKLHDAVSGAPETEQQQASAPLSA